ncbi:stage IV sporulation protein A [Orenia metallireducens]|jgi:stage IV sporulation protein A|uniref:Stage IV sporulation protein A n=1 Tax=Orenia metallireducens TaxID=1413210 RepID=A0A285HXP9_9FIRM|nr:stage IV sporulation protein A [Orenia metallireducens]PRX31001.1 stage IV sporulation protein A [Orenia metallireducens]SNY39481.1 stage IV sporulation protein A [Orenia metallireducens]
MERFDIYQDIATRTNGDIYVGVVGPVRTGKSTFIKKFMDLLVLPNMSDEYDRERTRDELPQSGEGRTIMTTEPKFVPNRATEISLDENVDFKIRLVDCVGYRVDGALGYEEEDGPRMVTTPWFEEAIPFQKAAEIGTQKVIQDHSTIGLVITTDGTITDLSRESYTEAEERVIRELNELGKPFIIALNSANPGSVETQELAQKLEEKYNKRVLPISCRDLKGEDISNLLQEVLYEFPLKEINLDLPLWIDELEDTHWLSVDVNNSINESIQDIYTLRDINNLVDSLGGSENAQRVYISDMDLGSGTANLNFDLKDELFYQVLEEMTDLEIKGEHNLFNLIKELSVVKKEYDQISDALTKVKETGYGIVTPKIEDLLFDEPELIKRGGHFGVKLRASAPSIHMIRADINTEVSPVVGTEKQCEELIEFFATEFEENPDAIWQSDFLGRSLHDLVKDGINQKLYRMPINAQEKLQDTLQKIINEGSGGLICIIL